MDQQQTEQLRYLFSRYVNGLSTRAEYDAFLQLVNDTESDTELKHLLGRLWEELGEDQPATLTPRRKPLIRKLATYGIAASVLLALTVGYYFTRQNHTSTEGSTAEQIKPVQQGISLKLASGKTILLTNKYKGNLTGTNARQQDSLLRYQNNSSIPAEEKNTLTNNGNEKFSITLSDGTEATLDIASSLTYPVSFKQSTRIVSMTGQAYFKVKHIQGQHFIVKAKNQTTEDIGTEFNIKAYEDEAVSRTTLIDGAIKVNERVLSPGEQAITKDNETTIQKANLEEVTAWLQGQLFFHHETLENIMKDVARVYNITVVWQDQELKKLSFGGGVTRGEKLATILNYFRKAGGVDFKVEGKTVTVFKPKKTNP